MMRKFKLEMFMQNLKFSFINLAEHCDKGYASGELKRATRALIPEKFPFSKKQTQGKFNKIIEILNDLYILLAQTLKQNIVLLTTLYVIHRLLKTGTNANSFTEYFYQHVPTNISLLTYLFQTYELPSFVKRYQKCLYHLQPSCS